MKPMSQNSEKDAATSIDPGEQQLGGIYAQALLAATEKVGQTETVLGELDSFVTDVLDRNPKFETILASVTIAPEDKEQIIDRVASGRASSLFVNLLKVLARHGRLASIRAVHRAAHDLFNEMRGRVRVEVTTAIPLDPSLNSQLAERLGSMLGRQPVLSTRIDPHVIGGIVLRVGDTVYDGSVATQLHRLSGQIVSRSIHEIQSRRDRFSHSAGN